jgi:hypothetical protein
MTGAVAPAAQRLRMEDQLVELAILGVLAERTEIYPVHLVAELRRRAPLLPPERIRPVLQRLWQERRVARLWHRYLLPDRVPEVRRQWLAMIDRPRTQTAAYQAGRAILHAWDGWHDAAAEA